METVLVGLGSNRGASVRIILGAIDRLGEFARGELSVSHLWRTSPVNCPPGADNFINAAVAFEPLPGLTPESLLRALKVLEREFGREEVSIPNAPRELDLDLLLFGREVRNTREFTLPHPRAVDRRFVLEPAAEVLPEGPWPGTGKTIGQLLAALKSPEQVVRLDEPERV